MAISPVISTSTSTGASASPSCAFGAGYTPQLNDLVILFFTTTATGVSLNTAPSGWVNALGGTTDVESDAHQASVAYHFVTQAEVNNSTTTYSPTSWYTASQTTGTIGVVLRGVDTTTPIDAIVTTFDSGNTATPHVIPAIAGANVGTNSMVLGYVCADGAVNYTDPSGWTLCAKNSGGQQGRAVYRRDTLTTAGVGVSSQNVTPSAGDEYIGIAIAITPLGAVVDREFTDTIGGTDALALEAGRQNADTVSVADALVLTLDAARENADAVGLVDAIAIDAGRDTADPVGVADVLGATRDFTRDHADPLGLSDALDTDVDAVREPIDAIGATDAATFDISITTEAADSAGVTDLAAIVADYERSWIDPVGVTDSATFALGSEIAAADGAGIADSAALAVDFARVLTDTAGLADTLALAADYVRAFADPVGLADTAAFQLSSTEVNATSPVGLSDSAQFVIPAPPDDDNSWVVRSETAAVSVAAETAVIALAGSATTSVAAETTNQSLKAEVNRTEVP